MMSYDCMLTTFDNPFDPFEQFTSWQLFDIEKGYYTCSHLARIINLTDDMSDEEVDSETERAIDEIIKYDFMNIYKKVTKPKEITEEDAEKSEELEENIQ